MIGRGSNMLSMIFRKDTTWFSGQSSLFSGFKKLLLENDHLYYFVASCYTLYYVGAICKRMMWFPSYVRVFD